MQINQKEGSHCGHVSDHTQRLSDITYLWEEKKTERKQREEKMAPFLIGNGRKSTGEDRERVFVINLLSGDSRQVFTSPLALFTLPQPE